MSDDEDLRSKRPATGMEGLGSKITGLRLVAGYSLSSFAEKLGTSKSLLSKIENDRAPLSFAMLDRIAEVVHKTPEAVVLYCLQQKYPRLMDTEVGAAMQEIANRLQGE